MTVATHNVDKQNRFGAIQANSRKMISATKTAPINVAEVAANSNRIGNASQPKPMRRPSAEWPIVTWEPTAKRTPIATDAKCGRYHLRFFDLSEFILSSPGLSGES